MKSFNVRANAETTEDAKRAFNFGARGIGLFRIEHMFYGSNPAALDAMRAMISADCSEDSINKLFPFVKDSIKAVLEFGHPVTIRLIDPPLHEFTDSKTEVNPMLGHRGVRLGITHPNLSRMQIKAIFEAAAELDSTGKRSFPEIMIPLTINAAELRHQKDIFDSVKSEYNVKATFGTMIETPAACFNAGELADIADFFSFGTNDLTQLALGFSRDDSHAFLRTYMDNGLLGSDPFMNLCGPVKQLIHMAIERGRAVKPALKVGLCGEQGVNDVSWLIDAGLDYISCSPYMIAAAKLAAAKQMLMLP